jgi:hypothetical protein
LNKEKSKAIEPESWFFLSSGKGNSKKAGQDRVLTSLSDANRSQLPTRQEVSINEIIQCD